ncbi:hypothetical protein ADK38_19095, partial [Streptomyces varsoviensis]
MTGRGTGEGRTDAARTGVSRTGVSRTDTSLTGVGAPTYREVWGELAPGGGREAPGGAEGVEPGGAVPPAAVDESGPHVLYAHFHRREPRGRG